jgi:type III secretion protein T
MELMRMAASLERLHIYLLAVALALSRMVGVMIVMPAFTRLGLTAILRGSVALVLSLPIVPVIVGALDADRLAGLTIAGLLFKEITVGVVVGLFLGVPFWAAEAAGDVLDLQRGAASASLFDPSAAEETSITGTFLVLAMLALYYGSGGLPITMRAVYDSYRLWPPGSFLPVFSGDAGHHFLDLLDDLLTMALMLVAPLVICMLLADIALGLLSRAAPSIHVFDLSLSAKSLVLAFLLALYSAFLVSYMGKDLGILLSTAGRLEAIAAPRGR